VTWLVILFLIVSLFRLGFGSAGHVILLDRSFTFLSIVMLTVELLQEMAPGEIFSRGIFKDDHIGINFM
jgi:hypothetical protein